MNNSRTLSLLSCLLVTFATLMAQAQSVANTTIITAARARSDAPLSADPDAKEWQNVAGIIAERGPRADLTPGHRTEVRARWTNKNLYLLFICPYEQLYSKPNPSTTTETNRLWEWDVAEVFIGSDFQDIKHYTEFQVSPHGEWVDLDIDRKPTPAKHAVDWDSGFEVKARIDEAKKIWYGEMRIPFAKIDKRPPKSGNELRINFYRFQGPPPDRKRIAWRPTNGDNYHVPEAFGTLRLQ